MTRFRVLYTTLRKRLDPILQSVKLAPQDPELQEGVGLPMHEPHKLDVNTTLSVYEHEAFHTSLLNVHEDDVIDQAVPAYYSVLVPRRATYHPGPSYPLHRHYLCSLLTGQEEEALAYMLSAEASLRANISAAKIITDCVWSSSRYAFTDVCSIRLLELSVKAAERYSLSVTGQNISKLLWHCPFVAAMYSVLEAKLRHRTHELHLHRSEGRSEVALKNPIFAMLLMVDVYTDPKIWFLHGFLANCVRVMLHVDIHPYGWWYDQSAINGLGDMWNDLAVIVGVFGTESYWEVLVPSSSDSLMLYTRDGHPRSGVMLVQTLLYALCNTKLRTGLSHLVISSLTDGIRTLLWTLQGLSKHPGLTGPLQQHYMNILLSNLDFLLYGCTRLLENLSARRGDTDGESCASFLKICLRTVQILISLDAAVEQERLFDPSLLRSDPWMARHYVNPHGTYYQCTYLCQFRCRIMAAIRIMKEHAGMLELPLLDDIVIEYGPQFKSCLNWKPGYTSARHRENVQLRIIAAFDTFRWDNIGRQRAFFS